MKCSNQLAHSKKIRSAFSHSFQCCQLNVKAIDIWLQSNVLDFGSLAKIQRHHNLTNQQEIR